MLQRQLEFGSMWQNRLSTFILYHKKLIVIVLSLLSLFFAYNVTKVSFDSSIDIWFLENDPNLLTYKKFLDRFGADEILLLGVFADEIFHPDTLKSLRDLTQKLEEAKHVHRVQSISNLRIIQADGDSIETSAFIKNLPKTEKEAMALKEKALRYKSLREMISEDGKGTAIFIELSHQANSFEGKSEMVRDVESLIQDIPGLDIKMSGSPYIDEAFFRYSKQDFQSLAPFAALIVMLIIYLVFRKISETLVPIMVVIVGNLWTFGLMGFLGLDVNMVTTSLFVVVLAVGVADSIHIQSEYYQNLAKGMGKEEALIKGVAHLIIPCLFTTVTTATGMMSLLSSQLKPIREFGYLAATGVSFAFLLTIFMVPLLLYWRKPPSSKFLNDFQKGSISTWLEKLGRPQTKKSVALLVGFGLLFIFSLYSLQYLKTHSNVMKYFRKGDPVSESILKVENALGGSAGVEFFIEAPNEGLKDNQILKDIADFQNWLESLEGITQTLSVADSIKETHRVFNEEDPNYFKIPDRRDLISQYYFILEGEDDFSFLVQENYSMGRISSRTLFSKAEAAADALPLIKDKLEKDLNRDGLKVEITGFVKLMGDMETYLVQSQIKSLGIALVAVTLMMMLLLRSIKLGLFSMIPNILPIFLGLAFMAWTDIPLNPSTIMIGSIALGLVVDDSVHYLVRLKRKVGEGFSLDDAIYYSMRETGRPIMITTFALSTSFALLVIGKFTPNIYFGYVCSLIILLALFADLVILPAALKIIKPKI